MYDQVSVTEQPMYEAARITDVTCHEPTLNTGPASPDVFIGDQKAWRALPADDWSSLEKGTEAMMKLNKMPLLTPTMARPFLNDGEEGLKDAAQTAASHGNVAAAGVAGSAFATLASQDAALTATYRAEEPIDKQMAMKNYADGIHEASQIAAAMTVEAIGKLADQTNCPQVWIIVPHGPGVITRGAPAVFINDLPATRQQDIIYEAIGGPDPVEHGEPTVFIGDEGLTHEFRETYPTRGSTTRSHELEFVAPHAPAVATLAAEPAPSDAPASAGQLDQLKSYFGSPWWPIRFYMGYVKGFSLALLGMIVGLLSLVKLVLDATVGIVYDFERWRSMWMRPVNAARALGLGACVLVRAMVAGDFKAAGKILGDAVGATARTIWGLAWSYVEPAIEAARRGEYGEAYGRAAFTIVSLLWGSKGLGKGRRVAIRTSLLRRVKNPKLRAAIEQLYRKRARYGDGGTADYIRLGPTMGRRGHLQKAVGMRRHLKEILRGRQGPLDRKEISLINRLIQDLTDVIEKPRR